MAVEAFIHWRRLDVQGRDACWLESTARGWLLYGAAVFAHKNGPAFINYNIEYDKDWNTTAAHIRGRAGHDAVEHAFARDAQGWTMNGERVKGCEALTQVDLGFTCATNLPNLKKLDLAIGDKAPCDVAWFDIGEVTPKPLQQSYARTGERNYAYEGLDYSAELTVADSGFVTEYPGLWQIETERDPT